jgi:dTDP-4-amino-4,6-dideoxygalactose transaminase
MSDLPLVDLRAQYGSIRGEVDAAIARVLERQTFLNGPETRAFEEEFAQFSGAAEAVAVANGTVALELALEAIGVGRGDEVVTVAHTFFATVEAVLRVGARPVLVDVDPDDWTLAPDRIAAAVGPRTRAIVPVHLYGHPADVPAIRAAAQGVPVVEDAAQAHGARYHDRPVGADAVAATFSFFPAKNLGAYGDAGAIVTNDAALASHLRSVRDHGRSSKYEHRLVGTNARMAELQAAVLRAKLPHLAAWTAERRRLSLRYEELLAVEPLRTQVIRPWADHARHLFVVAHPGRDRLRDLLAAEGIATGIHYPVPCHRLEALAAADWRAPAPLEATEELAATILSLPLYPELGDEGVERVAAAVERSLERLGSTTLGAR